jgi:hypothetical protein
MAPPRVVGGEKQHALSNLFLALLTLFAITFFVNTVAESSHSDFGGGPMSLKPRRYADESANLAHPRTMPARIRPAIARNSAGRQPHTGSIAALRFRLTPPLVWLTGGALHGIGNDRRSYC